ncbi:ferritin-like domain-containing protein [Sphingomonas rubra]|uniref:Ferritin-like domain-containing protein n=1 Tax=Sphingomonas rubra TaxID=634430 RepID=A0A1I5TV95_9SPHN|nr:ferritin-like domain-containing protein [Sphingomonas rubra]SFP87002.1 Ferritin-like domain-containing protein [Sphingomonas rubra]
MTDSGQLIEAMDGRVRRREERREFFRAAMGAGMVAVGGAVALGAAGPASAQAAVTDQDILNLALNLEYLEAQFYSFAATGAGLPEAQLTGTVGTRGQVTGGRQANLTDPAVIQYAREIASDERAHVAALRTALGGSAVAQPQIDISVAVFTAAARAANIDLSASGGVFDPYANDDNFLIGAYIFEDVGVTAYKGASPLIQDVNIVDAAAGILAAEAFHAGIIRSALYRRGVQTPVLRTIADRISDARDSLDGPSDLDQGISPTGTGNAAVANLVPADQNAIVFSRTPEQVHNIVYLTRNQVTAGGFFPAGTNNNNAALRRSGAN